jgi:hypothetical protein
MSEEPKGRVVGGEGQGCRNRRRTFWRVRQTGEPPRGSQGSSLLGQSIRQAQNRGHCPRLSSPIPENLERVGIHSFLPGVAYDRNGALKCTGRRASLVHPGHRSPAQVLLRAPLTFGRRMLPGSGCVKCLRNFRGTKGARRKVLLNAVGAGSTNAASAPTYWRFAAE